MIQSIVEQKAFQRGHEYFKEGRVRLLDAHETEIAATVRGNSGVYEQTIRLRDSNLVTACSCSLIEQPMCRHCVAVLLEYHRWSSQRGRREPAAPSHDGRSERAASGHNGNGQESRPQAAPAARSTTPAAIDQDVRLSDVIAFVEWAQPAMRSLAQSQALPDAPQFASGMVAGWVQTISGLNRQHREQEELAQALHADLAQRDVQLEQLRQQLQTAERELAASRQTAQRLQQEVGGYQGVLGKLGELTKGIGRFDTEVRSVAGDLSKSHAQLEQLAQSFREVSQSLQNLARTRPS